MSSTPSATDIPDFPRNLPVYRGRQLDSFHPSFPPHHEVCVDFPDTIPDCLPVKVNRMRLARVSIRMTEERSLIWHCDLFGYFPQKLEFFRLAQHHHVARPVYAYRFEPSTCQPEESCDYVAILMEDWPLLTDELSHSRPGQVLKWLGCLGTTLADLHAIGFRYDIRTTNILVRDGTVLLSGFNKGFDDHYTFPIDFAFPNQHVDWMAEPSRPREQRDSSSSMDIFALGTAIKTMLTKLYPDPEKNTVPGWCKKVLQICEKMVDGDPMERPDARTVARFLFRCNDSDSNLVCEVECTSHVETPGVHMLRLCGSGDIDHLGAQYIKSRKDTIGAVQQAAAYGHVGTLRGLRNQGFNMNLQDHSGQTALHWAALFGEAGAVSYLLRLPDTERGICDRSGRTSLHYAAKFGRTEITKMLLQLPSKAVQKRTQGSRGRELTDPPPNLKILEVNKADQYGTTALHLAIKYGSPETVELLLDHGANATRINFWEWPSYLNYAIKGTQALQDGQDRGPYEDVLNLLMPVVEKHNLLKRAYSRATHVNIYEHIGRRNRGSAMKMTDRVFSALAMTPLNISIGNSDKQGGRSMAKGMRSNDQEPPINQRCSSQSQYNLTARTVSITNLRLQSLDRCHKLSFFDRLRLSFEHQIGHQLDWFPFLPLERRPPAAESCIVWEYGGKRMFIYPRTLKVDLSAGYAQRTRPGVLPTANIHSNSSPTSWNPTSHLSSYYNVIHRSISKMPQNWRKDSSCVRGGTATNPPPGFQTDKGKDSYFCIDKRWNALKGTRMHTVGSIDSFGDDREFFLALRATICTARGSWLRRFNSWTTCTGLQLSKFTFLFNNSDLVKVSEDAAKKAEDLCKGYEYLLCSSQIGLDEHMQIMAEIILHGLQDPHLGLGSRAVLEGIPKLITPPGILKKQLNSGCGFYAIQGYCLMKILFWVGVMLSPGLAFILVWLSVVGALDLQNAFVPITFLSGLIAIILGISMMLGA